MNVQICRNVSPAGKAMAVCAALLCGLLFSVPAASAEEGDEGDAAKNPEIEPCPTPDETGSCDSCPDNDNNSSDDDNACVMVRIGLGDPFPASSGIATHLRLFSQHPSPELYSPSGLRLVTGFSVMYTTGGRTADGAPRSVVVLRPSGLAVTFTFADGESVAAAPDGTGKAFPYRLVMVDAQGWTTLSEPAFYDLYPGDGSSYRFVAAKAAPDYLQFVRHVSPYGQVSGLRELGVEAVRDAGGGLLQVRTAARLADIRIMGETSYAVRLYPNTPAAVSAVPGADGRYAVLDEGALIEELAFSDPGGEMKAFNVARTAGGATTVSAFTYTRETRDWTLAKPGGRVKEKRTVQTGGSGYRMTELVRDAEGNACSVSAHDFARYPWGAAVTTNWSGGFGSDDWKAYEYYEDAPLAGFLKRVTASDGSYKAYAFDAQRRKTSESGGGPGLPERETLYAYVPVDPAEAGIPALSDSRPRTVTEKIGGVEVSRVWHAYPTNALGGWMEIGERAAFQGAPYGHPSNPRTVKTWHAPDAEPRLAGRLASVAYPGGKTESYDYAWGLFNETDGTFTENPDGDAWRETVTTVYPTNLLPVTSYLLPVTRSLRVWDGRAREVLRASYIADGDAFAPLASARKFYDDAGHLIRTEHSDGRVESATWGANCCGKESATAADGTVTVYGYNELKQKVSETRKGLAPDGSEDITTLFTYDLDDRVLSVSVTNEASGLGYVDSRRAYDLGGRVTNAIDRLGNATRTSYAPLSTTVIRPNGVTAVTERYPDGKTRRVLENSVVKHSYAYGVNPDGAQWTLSAQGDLPAIPSLTDVADLRPLISDLDYPWQLQIVDSLGRTAASARPGFGGTVLVTTNAYDTAGNLLSTVSSSAEGVHAATLFSYHPDGTPFLTALDLNTNGVIDLGGPDRVTGFSSVYEKDASNRWWQVSRQWGYPESGSVSAVTTSVTRVLLTGLGVPASSLPLPSPYALPPSFVLTALSQSVDVRGNSTFSAVFTDRASKIVISASLSPTSVQPAVQTHVNGLLTATVSSTAVTNTYAYDGLARQTVVTDGRGNTTVTAYTPLGLVAYTEDAAANRTSYAYDALGRRMTVTDALGNTTHTAYDTDDRVTAQWGAAYPVAYEYDAHGRMAQMGTYRGAAEVTDYASFQTLVSSFDKTVWLYDQPTGLLTNKLYADGLGPAYTYTPDGKLATRLWARGITTTYVYAPFSGELTHIDYSDGTPDIAYTYDRRGNIVSVADASGTREFTTDTEGRMLTDAIQFQDEAVMLHEAYDAFGRSVGYALSNTVDGASSLITSVALEHDPYGRLSVCSVGNIPAPFRYDWLPGSDLVQSLAMPNGVTRQATYDPHRDLLASITHTNTAGTVLTRRTFAYDATGRLANRTQYRLGDETNRLDAFSYNPRSELTSAVLGTNDYVYLFDPIGNRISTTENTETTEYVANELNQYSQISVPSVPSVPSVVNPTYDADGNQTLIRTATGIWHVRYNGENRPVCFSNDTAVVDMDYDYKGRRFTLRVAEWNTPASQFQVSSFQRHLYRDYLRIAALDMLNNAAVIHSVVWDPTEPVATRPLLLSTQSGWHTYGFDQVKNVTELFDASGAVSAAYDYAPFGSVISANGVIADMNPIMFSSEVEDAVLGMVYYNWRHLDVRSGRWLSRDPIGEIDGAHLYSAMHNAACNFFDSLGKSSQSGGGGEDCCDQTELDNLVKKHQKVVDELRGKKNKDTNKPCLTDIKCGKCDSPSAGAEYSSEGAITVCSKVTEATFAHEVQHAAQCGILGDCEPKGPRDPSRDDCEARLCSEIEAYICGAAGRWGPCDKITPGHWNVERCAEQAWGSVSLSCPGCSHFKRTHPPLHNKCNFNPNCVIK
jgi:RHS repeat-associated protein